MSQLCPLHMTNHLSAIQSIDLKCLFSISSVMPLSSEYRQLHLHLLEFEMQVIEERGTSSGRA